jgi:hypothetical protein
MALTTCKNITVDGLDYCDRYVGSTNTTGTNYVVVMSASCDTITVRDITFGLKGTIANVHPYGGLFNFSASSNLKLRECGSRSAILSGGSANNPAYVFVDGGNNNGVQISRVYLQPTRTAPFLSVNSTTNIVIENVLADFADTVTIASLNTIVRGGSGTNTTTGQASVYGTHFNDGFTSATLGRVWLAMNEPTTSTDDLVTIVSGNPRFTSAGGLSMPTLGDQIIIEMGYYATGHTALRNVAPTLTGTLTGNHTIEYQIDVNDGSGYNGVWKTLNGANLSSETIIPSDGFRLKYRITTATANTTNLLSYIRIDTDSSLAAQTNNLYPLTSVAATFEFTGLEVGTEVVLISSTNTEIDRQVIASSTYTYSYNWNSNDGDVTGVYALIWKDDKNPIKVTGITLGQASQALPITQSDDLIYTTAATNATINFGSELIIMNAGATEYDVQEVYSLWKDQVLIGSNAQYDFAFAILGGNPTAGVNFIPFYTYLTNGWRIRPQEASHTLNVVNGILLVDGGGDPFVNTLGSFVVRINYQQPVQALSVSTSGSSLTAQDVWDYLASNPTTANSMKDYIQKIRGNTNLIPATL